MTTFPLYSWSDNTCSPSSQETSYLNAKQHKVWHSAKLKGLTLRWISTHTVSDTLESRITRSQQQALHKLLQRHHSVTAYLMEADLAHAVLETTGACTRREASSLMDLSPKLPDSTHHRDYKRKVFSPSSVVPLPHSWYCDKWTKAA